MASAPFGIVKLAPDLLGKARENPSAAAMLDALCTYAQRADRQVIATGVESPKLLAGIRAIRGSGDEPRIHAAQGYHLGKPQPQARQGPVAT